MKSLAAFTIAIGLLITAGYFGLIAKPKGKKK